MKPTGDDADYAYAVGRVRALESVLLSDAQLARLADSADAAGAADLLREHRRYADLGDHLDCVKSLDGALAVLLDAMRAEVSELSCHPEITDLWLARFDLDRLKRALRELVAGAGPDATERADPSSLGWPQALQELAGPVIMAAYETRDPLVFDCVLDTGYLELLYRAAQRAECSFLEDYARLAADLYNARAFLRAKDSRLSPQRRVRLFARTGLIPAQDFAEAFRDDAETSAVLARGHLTSMSLARVASGGEGALEQTDVLCDNAMTDFMAQAKRLVFGIEPLFGYAYAVELETINVRRALVGQFLGVAGAQIRERLRRSYV